MRNCVFCIRKAPRIRVVILETNIMNALLVTILMFFTAQAIAQIAIIRDNDGYVNVRKEPHGQAEVIRKIYENEVFWYEYTAEKDNEKWAIVYMPKSKYSFNCSVEGQILGFMHISRLQPLYELEEYKGVGFTFEYTLQPFDSTAHIIERIDGEFVIAIDGRPFWGTDGGLPTSQVQELQVTIDGVRIEIHPALYSDIYGCYNGYKVYTNGDAYFVHDWNSDGAGAYEIVWVFMHNELKQRLVGSVY